jgi:diadenosine tetraphosphatase ApaH/serine/threonine PP2A family protein phosphatase
VVSNLKGRLADGADLAFCDVTDLMWSDPDDIDTWSVSPRGAGWLFGAKVTREVSLPPSRPKYPLI